MTYFLIRVIVNTLAAAIVMNVVPGLRLLPFTSFGEPFAAIFSYMVVGLIFGVLHAFVRLLILFLTGRLYCCLPCGNPSGDEHRINDPIRPATFNGLRNNGVLG